MLTASGALYAGPVEDLINALDTDLDGRLSLEEAAANPALEANFQLLDADQDGFLTPKELEPFIRQEQVPG